MTEILEADHRAVLAAFARHDVAYVLVGGVALQIWGWKGTTADVDLTVATDDANVQRVNVVLGELGAGEPQIGALGTAFETRHGRVELVRVADGIGEFPNWARRAQTIDVDGVAVRVAHPEDLIASKEAAGRPKDLDILPVIRRDLIDAGHLAPDGHDVAPPQRDTPAYLREAIGQRPTSQRAARLWDNAAQRIDEHREQWAITDPQRAFGAEPASAEEAADRHILERTLQRTQTMIARVREPPGWSIDMGR